MKEFLLVLLTFVLIIVLVACKPATNESIQPDFVIEGTATVKDIGHTAADLLTTIMETENIVYTLINGNFDNVGGLTSTVNESWNFYYNDELTSKPTNISLLKGDVVALRWESNITADKEKSSDNKLINEEDIEIIDEGVQN